MAKRESRPWIVSDGLCLPVEPLLPGSGPKLVAGRPRVPDRQALCGILFVLHTGIQWEYLPQELGFGSGMTCWRRLAAWNAAGVWDRLHVVLLGKLRAQGIKPVIARRGVLHGSGLGAHRWVVERTIAWFHGFRRLRIRWERRDDIHEAFLGLATCLITHRHVQCLCQDL
ncbi:transposase [Streptomyces sp. NBC_00455]